MQNMVDYIRQTQETFAEKVFNEVDSLVLCQLSYLKFDGLAPTVSMEEKPKGKFRRSRKRITIKRLDNHPDRERLFRDERYAKDNRELWAALVGSRRFQNVELDYAVDEVSREAETQFSAVTFFLPVGPAGGSSGWDVYVAYRGTDESIVGWKEDFNLAFSKPVPAQEKSVDYLNRAAAYVRGTLYVGGHSKGGNLAIYAAMHCKRKIQDKIRIIYSMDGPGFREETLKAGHFETIAGRVVKIMPHSALVGMLFEKSMNFEVVESGVTGLMQHYPMTWVVRDGAFVRKEKLFEPAAQLDGTVNEWMESLDENHIRVFVDTLFEVLYASETDNLIDFTSDWKKTTKNVFAALKELDEETKTAVRDVIRAFFDMGRSRMRNEMTERLKFPKTGQAKKMGQEEQSYDEGTGE